MRLGNIYINRNKKIESIKKISKNITSLIDRGYKVILPEGQDKPSKIGEIKPGVSIYRSFTKTHISCLADSGSTWPKNSLKIKKKNIFIKSFQAIPYGLAKKKFKDILRKI